MPTPTYTPLATVTLGSSAASVTFSSIPATYRDLVLVITCRTNVEAYPSARFNSDTASNYSRVGMSGDGSSTYSYSGTLDRVSLNGYAASSNTTDYNTILQVMDYSATDKHKTALSRANNTGYATDALALRWANTAAITSLQVYVTSATFNAGSTFSLYGVIA
jgi:hypothetical protein